VHNNFAEDWKITLVETGPETLTGGRIKRVQKYIGDEPFMLTYGDGVSNVNIKELIDKITDPSQAFTNPQNYNRVRYYNKTGQAIDTFDTMQIKMVMLSSNPNVVPRIASLSAVGLSS
jgi:hypothetical protein